MTQRTDGPAATIGQRAPKTSAAERLTWATAGLVFLFAALATSTVFWVQDGDAAVYWVYARSMWRDGMFHFAHAPVSYGATSPAWAVLLSVASLPAGGASILLWKLAGVLAWIVLATLVYVLGHSVSASRTEAIGAAALVALHPGLRTFAVSSYETPFFAALVANAALATVLLPPTKPRPGALAYSFLSLALLPLGRPEGLLVAGSLAAVTLARHRSVRMAALLACTLIPYLGFAAWMHAHTGAWVPSSVAARQMMSAVGDSYLVPTSPLLAIARGLGVLFEGPAALRVAGYAMQALLLGAGAASFARSRPAFCASYAVVGLMLALGLSLNNPGYYLMRYAMPILPFAAVAMARGAGVLFRTLTPRLGAATLPAAVLLGALAFGQHFQATIRSAARDRFSPVDVLDTAGAATLNPLLRESDVILTYEVQTAYHLDAPVVSADGIVGGEILPYLRNGDIAAFIREHRISVVLTSTAYGYRSVYRNTLLEQLAAGDAAVRVGDLVTLGGVTFRKIAAQPRVDTTAFWRGAYAVVS